MYWCSSGFIDYPSSDFVSFEEEMVKRLNRIDRVMGEKDYAEATKEKWEDVRLGDLSKYKKMIKREGIELKVSSLKRVLKEKTKNNFIESIELGGDQKDWNNHSGSSGINAETYLEGNFIPDQR